MAHHCNYNKTAILFIIILVFNDVGSVKHSGCWIAFGDRRDLGKLADLSKLSELGKFVELSGLGESSNPKSQNCSILKSPNILNVQILFNPLLASISNSFII